MASEETSEVKPIAEAVLLGNGFDAVVGEQKLLGAARDPALLDVAHGSQAQRFPEAANEVIFAHKAQ
jgi:hypothetical protein